jgi:type IX secretion system PorP/SprF family membrane protein
MIHMILRYLCLVLLICAPFYGNSQQFPLYTQYMFNPYMVNPSALATARKSELNLFYRQQWTGIEDGPQTIQVDYQHALDNRMALGVNIYNDESILLSNISTMATFGYKVPLAKDHILGFGLSAGFLSSRLKVEDIADVDSSDPVILNNSSNSFAFNGAFGVNYTYRNFIIGGSFIRLFDNKNYSADSVDNLAFSQLKDRIVFAGYTFHLSETFNLQPNFSYRFTADNLNFYEASAIFSYKEMISLGGGYRENFGPTAIVRVAIKDLQIGFAYDFPSTKASVSTGGTNEIQLKWRFGKVMDRPAKKEKNTTTIAEEPITSVEEKKVEEKTEANPVVVEPEPTPAIVEPEVMVITEQVKPNEEVFAPSSEPTSNEFLMVVGSFNRRSNADKLVRELSKSGYQAETLKSPTSDYYYVHLPAYKTDSVTLEKVLELRKEKLFKDAWFKKVE